MKHTREEVASKAGVDADYVDRLVELGMITPGDGEVFSSGDVRRARWIRSLEGAGVPLEGMAAAVRGGTLSFSFLDMSAFDRFAGLTGTTFRQLSEETGISLELLSVVREALGHPEPSPEDYVREDELSVARAVEFQISNGWRPVVIERLLRVYADCFRRIAETEADGYQSEVVVPLLETGMSGAEMLDSQAAFGSENAPLQEQTLLAIYHGQQERSWTKGFVEEAERTLERAGLYSRLHSPPAVSFLDLTGYTSLTDEQGDEAAAELAAKLRVIVQQSSVEHGGESVKWLGDGVMFYFQDPSRSVLAALDMVERAATEPLPPARVGIHAGPVVFQEGDYFGPDCQYRCQDCRLLETRGGAREPGSRGVSYGRWPHLQRDRACLVEGSGKPQTPLRGTAGGPARGRRMIQAVRTSAFGELSTIGSLSD